MADTPDSAKSQTPSAPQLLTLEQAAALLQCHRTTIGRLVAQGDLACIRYSDRPGARMLFTMELLSEFLGRRAKRRQPIATTPTKIAAKRTRPQGQPSPWEEPSSTADRLW
jgi:excisionase family DNA binding protein